MLPPESVYFFSDVSDVFLNHGRVKFAALPHMRYATFNAETGEAKGVAMEGKFDVVVATNAIHAVRDLDVALQNVRSLLAPGGCFILCEVTEHLSWFEISTGLIEGWQAFEDRWRASQPLLSVERWSEALASAGFDGPPHGPKPGRRRVFLLWDSM